MFLTSLGDSRLKLDVIMKCAFEYALYYNNMNLRQRMEQKKEKCTHIHSGDGRNACPCE